MQQQYYYKCAYLFGNFSHEVHSGLKRGKHNRTVLTSFRKGADTHRYLCDHTQYSLRAENKVLDIRANGITGTLKIVTSVYRITGTRKIVVYILLHMLSVRPEIHTARGKDVYSMLTHYYNILDAPDRPPTYY